MKKIEASSLKEAYTKATEMFNVSITKLDIEVIQNPSKGIFGLMKKNAILIVDLKNNVSLDKISSKVKNNISNIADNIKDNIENIPKKIIQKVSDTASGISQTVHKVTPDINVNIFESFFENKETIEDISSKIEEEIKNLMKLTCYEIETIAVKVVNKTTIEVYLDGADSALLIGKEGYRYKAISYLLFNWINLKYGLQVRLEISEFYKNQTQTVCSYLETIYGEIENNHKFKTKVLDGVLLQIALAQLRKKYENKYIATRSQANGKKYIVINNFYKK